MPEMSIGLDPDYCNFLHLDWIRTANRLKNLRSGMEWTELMEKNCGISVVKKLYFVHFLDFIWTGTSHLKKILDYGWTSTES